MPGKKRSTIDPDYVASILAPAGTEEESSPSAEREKEALPDDYIASLSEPERKKRRRKRKRKRARPEPQEDYLSVITEAPERTAGDARKRRKKRRLRTTTIPADYLERMMAPPEDEGEAVAVDDDAEPVVLIAPAQEEVPSVAPRGSRKRPEPSVAATSADVEAPAGEGDRPRPDGGRKKTKPAAATDRRPCFPGGQASMSFRLPRELCERLRNAVWHLAGAGEKITLGKIAEAALRREIERLEKERSGGEPFPEREGDLRTLFLFGKRR